MASIERVAGIDIGTNSLRVLVADIDNLSRVIAGMRLGFAVRLGEGLSATGRVSEAALERNCRVLGKSTLLARRLGVSRMLAGATHALRVAVNSADVVTSLEEASGVPVRILMPEEEAYYVYTGALSDATSAENGFVIDVGGGSTSLIKGTRTGKISSCMISLGCVTLTERFLEHDPPLPEELKALGEHIVAELSKAEPLVVPEADAVVTGVGGAVTSLAVMSLGLPTYEARRVEGHILTREDIDRCAQRLSRLPLEERETVGALGRRRAEIAVAGAFILSLVTCHLNARRLTVSTKGLRYGLALEAAAHPAG